jgi:uncharacterized protein YdcH (DUF465 family)
MYANNEMFGDLVHDVSIVGHLIGNAGASIRNFFIKGVKPSNVAPAPEMLRTRELQSAKIELRLLGRQHRYDDILHISTNSDNDEVARLALLEIVEGDLDSMERIQFISAIANSFSRAAVLATVVLYNRGETDLALSIFLERLVNGELAKLVHSGRARLLSVLDLLGALDTAQETEHSSVYFDQLFQSLAGLPDKQIHALLEILGDPKPAGPRGVFSGNSITQAVKLKAIDLLRYAPVEIKDRALSFAAKDDDEVIAQLALQQLIQLWQSQNANGMVPQGLEPFPLLQTNLLIQLCQISAAFKWNDHIATDNIQQRYLSLMDEQAALDANQDPAGFARLQRQIDKLDEEINRLTTNRINMLQPLINKITQSLGIPNAALSTTDDPAVFASYVVGGGCIELSRSILLDDQPLSEDLMSTLLHEIGHMEQDVLVIRMIADDIGLKFGQHAELLYPLYERYAAGIGYAPQSMFLLAVLRLRADRPLTLAQRQRAMRLHQAAYQAKMNHEGLRVVKKRFARLSDSYDQLDDGKHDGQLLGCLSNTKAIAGWFNQGAVPAVLLYEIENCKQDLSHLFSSVSTSAPPRDIVNWAQKAFQSDLRRQILPIVHRLRTLLMQVLSEECQRLDKEMAELRRAGYPEAEAYTISDRVEVIVKALRKNW